MSFRDIKGNEQAITRLKNYLAQGQLSGPYLFAGPDGVGKNLVARTLAKAANCEKNSGDSCDQCRSCVNIDNGQHPDVHTICAEGDSLDIKIEYIRGLQSQINLRAYEGRKKVFIIPEAHHMTPDASNAFLKTLEEPPEGSLIILLSSKPALILKTILSRCQMIKFSALDRARLKELLCREYALDAQNAHFLSYFSEGRLGAAISLKDSDLLEEKNRIIDSFILASELALTEQSAAANREYMRRALNITAMWFRDVYLLKSGLPAGQMINSDRQQDLRHQAEQYSFAQLDAVFSQISNAMLYIEQNVNIKLLLSHVQSALKA